MHASIIGCVRVCVPESVVARSESVGARWLFLHGAPKTIRATVCACLTLQRRLDNPPEIKGVQFHKSQMEERVQQVHKLNIYLE